MDGEIYKLIANAQEENNVDLLKQAYAILDPESHPSKDKTNIDTENISQNLYVQCAEAAIALNEIKIANRCIQIYFNIPMISNQFVARAYLCQFQLLAPEGTHQIENLDKSIPFLYKTIEFSKQNKRYHFLIYNASVIYWKFVRSFMKDNFKKYLCTSLQIVVDALNEIDDPDHEWRATLTKFLIKCYIDNKDKEKAIAITKKTEEFIRKKVPSMYTEFFAFSVKYDLIDKTELDKITKKAHLYSIYKIETLRTRAANLEKPEEDEIGIQDLNELYKFMIPSKSNPGDSKNSFESEAQRRKLLVQLAQVALLYSECTLSSIIVSYLKERETMNEELLFEVEFIECEQSVKELRHKQEKYNKASVKIRVDAIKRCDDLLKNVLRFKNPDLIQFGCTTQWNLCLPLLQPGLRKDIRKPLQFVCDCLQDIDSLDWVLRCQIHFELSKCEEEIEQLQIAEQHLIKALSFDDQKIYTDQLNFALQRLRLRAELYKTPERVEDQAAMIIEQSVKTDSKSKANNREINTRSLLMRAADLLAGNEFAHVMESETFKQGIGKLNEDMVSRLVAKSRNYSNCVSKCRAHVYNRLKDVENVSQESGKEKLETLLRKDFKERLKLWYDLSKAARKQQIWDVCRVASRFCLLHDDEKLLNKYVSFNDESVFFNKELMRNLAEIHFIKGEALIQFIRGENVELFIRPTPPQSQAHETQSQSQIQQKAIQNQQQRNFDTDVEWNEYCDWVKSLCDEAVADFLRAIKIGTILGESWLVAQGAAYCWNYLHHLFEAKKYTQCNSILTEVFDALKKVGHDTEPHLLVNVSVALATGLISPWMPPEQPKQYAIPVIQNDSVKQENNNKLKPAIAATGQQNASQKAIILSAEATSDIKKALEVCEYAMQVTNGDNLADVVHLQERLPLIKVWVLAKHLLQSPIRNFGLTNLTNPRVQDRFTKCLVAVEMLERNAAGSQDFKDVPPIKEVISFVDQASNWPDKLIELQLWCRLAVLSHKVNETENLRYVHRKALESVSYFEKKKSENKQVYVTSQVLLSETCIALGEHLENIVNGTAFTLTGIKSRDIVSSHTASSTKESKLNLRREAINAMADGAGYAARGENYDLAIHAARHYWNLCLPYLKKPIERAMIIESLREILTSLAITYKLSRNDADGDAQGDEKNEKVNAGILKKNGKKGLAKNEGEKANGNLVAASVVLDVNSNNNNNAMRKEDAFDDLTLRSALYGVLFQILTDKRDYEDALEEMERALNDMPRTNHRLLIYRYRVMTKAKLGLDVQMDLQKFREEGERSLAMMYRRVALSSSREEDIIVQYQRAIETLTSEESIWLKFEYLVELAQWLFSNEYKLDNCIDLMELAIDIITNYKHKEDKPRSTVTSAASKQSKLTKKSQKQQPNASEVPVKTLNEIPELKSEMETDTELNRLQSETKEILLGVLPANKNIQLSDFVDIKQLECLIRANVILAQMSPRGTNEFRNYLLKAYCFVMRVINQAVDNAFSALKEKQKLDASEEAANAKKQQQAKAGAGGKAPENAKGVPTAQTGQKKLKDTSSASYLPKSCEEWSSFEIGDEIVSIWTHDLMKKNGLNLNTIPEPLMLFYYLDKLAEMLGEFGYNHLLFGVFNLQLYVAKTALMQKFSNSDFYSLNCYVRLKCINLCVELNLMNSIGCHQQALVNLSLLSSSNGTAAAATTTSSTNVNIGNLLKIIQIDANELSYIRDEIYAHNQRKAQAYKDELANNSSFLSKTTLKDKPKKQTFANMNEKKANRLKTKMFELKFPGEQKNVSASIAEILYRDVWLLIADTLVKNGFYQNARDFLFEALHSSQNFEDKFTTAKVNYLLGQFSLFNKNYLEAIHFTSIAQKTAIDEQFWFKCVLAIFEATKTDIYNKDSRELCVAVLNKALEVIDNESRRRNNKATQFAYMKAILTYELAMETYEEVLKKHKDPKMHLTDYVIEKVNSMRPVNFKKLIQVAKMFEKSSEILHENGFKRDTVKIYKARARLLKRFADDCLNIEAKHDYLLQTHAVISEGCNMLREMWYDAQNMQSPQDTQNASLPVHREYIDLALDLVQLQIVILENFLNELKEKNAENLKKHHYERALEEYIRNDENLSETEREWNAMVLRLPEEIISSLITCLNGSIKIKQLKCRSLFNLGHFLRILSEIQQQQKASYEKESIKISVIALSKWDAQISELLKTEFATVSNVEIEEKPRNLKNASAMSSSVHDSHVVHNFDAKLAEEPEDIHNESFYNKPHDQEAMRNLLCTVNRNESIAMEALMQALNLAISLQDKTAISEISYELINLTGNFDPQLCSQFISLHQSALNANEMEHMLAEFLEDPKDSLLAAYLHQLDFFRKINVTKNILNSPLVTQINEAVKNKFQSLKNLSISPDHFNFLKELPANYVVIMLQHNASKTELLASVVDHSKPAAAAQKQAKQLTNQPQLNKTIVVKADTDPIELNNLLHLWRTWKKDLHAFNLRVEFQANHEINKKEMMANLNTAGIPSASEDAFSNQSAGKTFEMVEIEKELESTFKNLIEQTENYLQPVTQLLQEYFTSAPAETNSKTAIEPPKEKLILLADLTLMEFPLESLRIFRENNCISSISRDFSIQFFHNRLLTNTEESKELNVGGDDKKQKGLKDKKPVSSGVDISETAIKLDPTQLKYLVDINSETTPTIASEFFPANTFKAIQQQFASQTAKWQGLISTNSSSLGERERLLESASSFIFYGMERFLSYYKSSKIPATNLNHCNLLVSNDMAQTCKSFNRAKKTDVFKKPIDFKFEQPLQATVLLSLAGVKCLVANQWSANLIENSNTFKAVFKDLLGTQQSTGEVIRYKFSPQIKKALEEKLRKEEEKKAEQAQKEKEKKETKTDKDADKHKSTTARATNNSKLDKRANSPLDQSVPTSEEEPQEQDYIKKEIFNMVCYGLPDIYLNYEK